MSDCKVEEYSSRVCERGTKSCVVRHELERGRNRELEQENFLEKDTPKPLIYMAELDVLNRENKALEAKLRELEQERLRALVLATKMSELIRQFIPDNSLCKTCVHVLRFCKTIRSTHTENGYTVTSVCDGYESLPKREDNPRSQPDSSKGNSGQESGE